MRSRMKWSAGSAGVTLLEVMLTVTVVGVGLGAVLSGLSACARLCARGREMDEACALAQRQAAYFLSLKSPGAGDHEGTFDAPHDALLWQARIWTADAGRPFDLLRLDIYRRDKEKPVYEMVLPLPRR